MTLQTQFTVNLLVRYQIRGHGSETVLKSCDISREKKEEEISYLSVTMKDNSRFCFWGGGVMRLL